MVFVKDLLEKEIPIYRKPIHFRIFRVRLSPAVYFAGAQVHQRLFPEFREADGTIIYTKQVSKVPRSKTEVSTYFGTILKHTHTHTPLLALHPPNQKHTHHLTAILRSETPGREYLEAALRSPSFVRVAAVLMP